MTAATAPIAEPQVQAQPSATDVTKNDRFAAVLVIAAVVMMVLCGLVIKGQSASDTWTFTNKEAGIDASYPAGWLVDQGPLYVARIRNPKARPYKTQFMLTVVPAGGETSVRNVLDSLTLQRSVDLPAYRVLDVEQFESGGAPVTQMNFVYVETDPNPFIERLPVVVRGVDRVVLDGNRAIIISYMAEQSVFESGLPAFERFIASLRY
jgi:hypothetical protein